MSHRATGSKAEIPGDESSELSSAASSASESEASTSTLATTQSQHAASTSKAFSQPAKPLPRRSKRKSGVVEESAPTTSTSAVGSSKKRKRPSAAATQAQDLPSTTQDASQTAPRRSRRSLGTATQATNPPQPSTKSLGKRRAVSPAPEAEEEQASTSRPSKRRKTEPSESRSYNLRSRPSDTKPAKKPKVMPRKGKSSSGANSPAKAKAEMDEPTTSTGFIDDLPPSGGRANKRRARTSAAAASPAKETASTSKPRTRKSAANEVACESSAAVSRPSPSADGSVRMEVDEPILDGDVEFEMEEGGNMAQLIDAFEDEEDDEGGDVIGGSDEEGFVIGEEAIIDPEGMDEQAVLDQQDEDEPEEREYDDEGLPVNRPAGSTASNAASTRAALDDTFNAFSGMGGFASMMSGFTSRLRSILTNLKDRSPEADPSLKLMSLQDLSEILSISTEDTLTGMLSIDAFCKELVHILRGEDPLLMLNGEENLMEMMLLACRCLANLMEALPGSSHSVVANGAVPVLCAKLLEIQYIDLAEQTLSTLEKISLEMPGSVVREGGLTALLTYLDFFSTHVQRTAVTAAANCCRSLSVDSFPMVQEITPILQNVLSYSDQRVVEQACMAVTRIVDSYRHHPDKLEALLTADLLGPIEKLLIPGNASPIGSSTYTQVLRMLGIAAKASPEVSIALIEMNIANTLYSLLGGLSPPPPGEEIAGVKKHREENDMYVLQNLVHRPKEQVQEALVLVGELLPALPRDGIFSSKPNASRSGRKAKKVKRETASPTRATQDQDTAAAEDDTNTQNNVDASVAADDNTPAPEVDDDEDTQEVKLEDRSDDIPSELQAPSAVPKEKSNDRRIAQINSDSPERATAVKRYLALMLPMLVEVYSASVGVPSKSKAITAICKIVFYCPKEDLQSIISGLPIAGFLGSVLASRDQSSLVITALQLVELFLVKLPATSHYQFRREGVLHGIQELADAQLVVSQANKNTSAATESQPQTAPVTTLDSASAAETAEIAALARILRQNERTAAALVSADDHMKDLITLRAKFVRDRYCSTSVASASQAVEDLDKIKTLVAELRKQSSSADTSIVPAIEKTLQSIVDLFADPDQPLSSFEMTESGLVSALLHFSSAQETSTLSTFARQELLAKAFGISPAKTDTNAYAVIVSRLQNSMSKMEEFDVVTALQGTVERNSASMLARQLKLKLVSDDEGVPRSCNNVIVSIHAIATFQAFNDYLRPRIAAAATAASNSGSSRLSGALAAFASGGGLGELAGALAQAPDPSTSAAPQESTSASTGDKSLRRRSSRLSAKEGKESQPSSSQPPTPREVETPIDDTAAATTQDDESAPVSVEPSADGSRLEGHTSGGTRVATPAFGKAATSGSSQPALARAKGSYAAALKTEPTDFHLKFYMGDVEIAHDTTVYGAVHQHELRQNSATSRTMWSNIYTVRFKKFSGPAPLEAARSSPVPHAREGSSPLEALPSSIVAGSRQAEVLQLLRVFHLLNSDMQDVLSTDASTSRLPTTAFVNNKLTAKLNRQLEEPMIVASSCLPEWALELPQSFSFLFPFETRFSLLQSTSFGYARLMQKWLGQARSETRRDESLSFLGRLQRQKVRIARDRLLESAFKVFELYGQSRAMLEIEFFDEVGTGLGPTLEFYALVSKEFSFKNLGLWRNSDDAANPSLYVDNPCGLFPAPIANANAVTDGGRKITTMFRFLGQFIAKSLMDSRIIDLPFSRTFMKLLLDRQLPIACSSVKAIDPVLGKSLDHLEAYVIAREEIKNDSTKTDQEKVDALSNIRIKDATIADLSLDFTLPGYSSIHLMPDGDQLDVTIDNVDEYISLVIEYTLVSGVSSQVQAFREGFSEIFPVKDLACFSAEELVMLFGNNVEDWSAETLSDSLRADHGFSMDSKVVKDLVGMMVAFEDSERRAFLSFATGSPRLPVGGFRALHPSLTVVRKLPEPGHHADEYLPSVMTCQNYVKMPEYSSSTVLKERLTVAVQEGQGAFHLS